MIRDEGVVRVAALAEHPDEVIEQIRAGGKPVLVTHRSKMVGYLVPMTLQQAMDKLMEDPSIRESLERAQAAFEAGQTISASRFLELDAQMQRLIQYVSERAAEKGVALENPQELVLRKMRNHADAGDDELQRLLDQALGISV